MVNFLSILRDISIDDIGDCIMSGEIIEDYPDDFPHPSCLIFGYTIRHKVLHTVVGSDGEVLHIITTNQADIRSGKERNHI